MFCGLYNLLFNQLSAKTWQTGTLKSRGLRWLGGEARACPSSRPPAACLLPRTAPCHLSREDGSPKEPSHTAGSGHPAPACPVMPACEVGAGGGTRLHGSWRGTTSPVPGTGHRPVQSICQMPFLDGKAYLGSPLARAKGLLRSHRCHQNTAAPAGINPHCLWSTALPGGL